MEPYAQAFCRLLAKSAARLDYSNVHSQTSNLGSWRLHTDTRREHETRDFERRVRVRVSGPALPPATCLQCLSSSRLFHGQIVDVTFGWEVFGEHVAEI